MNNPETIILTLAFIFIIVVGSLIFLNPYHDDLSWLENSHEQIIIDGRIYRLETYLWRDFMPGSPSGGTPLIAVVKVIPNDTLPFPSNVDTDHIWVINGEEIWSSELSEENTPQENHLEKIARNGPKWETGITVDVVIQVVTNTDTYLLKAANQLIHRTS